MKPMSERLKENEPYNVFFTTVADFPETHTQKNAITFTDLLCPSLGELKCSLQLNFLMEINWLMEQYDKMGQGNKPLTVMYGYEADDCQEKYGEEFLSVEHYIKQTFPNVQARFVQTKDSYGIHHSKVGIYVYKDNSLRIVISTANLYSLDWDFYCNGLWISPLCPPLPKTSRTTDGAGPTNFKSALSSYIQQYKDPLLNEYIEYILRADFSAVKVCLVTSAPGLHRPNGWPIAHSHLQTVGKLLSLHCKLPGKSPIHDENTSTSNRKSAGKNRSDMSRLMHGIRITSDEEATMMDRNSTPSGRNNMMEKETSGSPSSSTNQEETKDESLSWEIIAQASSIGYLGDSQNDWLCPTLLRSLASHTNCRLPNESEATIKIVYPTKNEVLNGHHGASGGGCACYWMDVTQENLQWPLKYLHSWKADNTNRSKATPHIKTYCRMSPCLSKMAWYLLTSANISKSAWGSGINKDGAVYVRSYEVGVLFLPKYFGETYFQIKSEISDESVKLFPIIYDLPLEPYGAEDVPWSQLQKESD